MPIKRRSVLAIMLIVTLATAVIARADEDEAVRTVERLEGNVRRDHERIGKPVFAVFLMGPQVNDRSLKVLKELRDLQVLKLGAAQITNEGLKELQPLTGLQKLDLSETGITDAGLFELKDLKELQSLKLFETRISDIGLKAL
ncbi:MAG TPA: hypothetical protein VHC19_19635, partial [Pirellulales bacterium]|nr:hypothetical protein [Pirellulales bacterium]